MSNTVSPYPDDPEQDFDDAQDLAANDAVAGETVWPGAGDDDDVPTGGSPREGEPDYVPNDLAEEDIDLDEEP